MPTPIPQDLPRVVAIPCAGAFFLASLRFYLVFCKRAISSLMGIVEAGSTAVTYEFNGAHRPGRDAAFEARELTSLSAANR